MAIFINRSDSMNRLIKELRKYNRWGIYDDNILNLEKGQSGEYNAIEAIKKLSDEYLVLHDVVIPTQHRLVQIDLIVMSSHKFIEVECKYINFIENEYDKQLETHKRAIQSFLKQYDINIITQQILCQSGCLQFGIHPDVLCEHIEYMKNMDKFDTDSVLKVLIETSDKNREPFYAKYYPEPNESDLAPPPMKASALKGFF